MCHFGFLDEPMWYIFADLVLIEGEDLTILVKCHVRLWTCSFRFRNRAEFVELTHFGKAMVKEGSARIWRQLLQGRELKIGHPTVFIGFHAHVYFCACHYDVCRNRLLGGCDRSDECVFAS